MKHVKLFEQFINEGILQEKINMKRIYNILKTNDLGPEIADGNKITGIKSIDFGTYNKKDGSDFGRMTIDSNGQMYGEDLWGFTIKNDNELLDAIDVFRKDQKELYKK